MGTKMTNLGIDFRFLPRYNLLTKPMSKYVDNSEKLSYDGIRTHVRIVIVKGELK